jgi:hypothetical protein
MKGNGPLMHRYNYRNILGRILAIIIAGILSGLIYHLFTFIYIFPAYIDYGVPLLIFVGFCIRILLSKTE